MNISATMAVVFQRDLKRLLQEVEAFPDDVTLWQTMPGVTNSAGNLILHLEGNLREFIGRQLGHVPYQRQRDLEFSSQGIGKSELGSRVSELVELIPPIVERLTHEQLEADFPQAIFGKPLPTSQIVLSLMGHLSYHMGEIDYLRRILTQGGAISFANF